MPSKVETKTPSSGSCSRKPEGTAIDSESFFRNWIDSLFITASWVDAVQIKTGIRGVSQVWSDRPEWYIWIDGTAGPFGLALQSTDTIEVDKTTAPVGRFTVRCYPYASDPSFPMFSEAERRCVNGDGFDHTRTPVADARPDIPETFFVIGVVSIVVDPSDSICMITYDSLQSLRTRERERDRITREVPGWRLGYPLFDRLAMLYVFFSKRIPFRYGAIQAPGFEVVTDATGQSRCRDNSSLRQLSASLLFCDPSIDACRVGALWQGRLEITDEVLFETEFGPHPPNCLIHSNAADSAFSINPEWWHLTTMTARSHLASTCGCDGNCEHEHIALGQLPDAGQSRFETP